MEIIQHGNQDRLLITDPNEYQAARILVGAVTKIAVSQKGFIDDETFQQMDGTSYYLENNAPILNSMAGHSPGSGISFSPEHADCIRLAIESFRNDPETFDAHITPEESFIVGLYFAPPPRTAE